jgi:hypothetical protein
MVGFVGWVPVPFQPGAEALMREKQWLTLRESATLVRVPLDVLGLAVSNDELPAFLDAGVLKVSIVTLQEWAIQHAQSRYRSVP